MDFNLLALILAAMSSLAVGMVWYHPKVLGTIWMREAGLNFNPEENFNMLKTFSLAIFYAFLMAFILQFNVIHQFGAYGMIGGDIANAAPSYAAFMADYGNKFHSFGHGALHGFMVGLLLLLPSVGISSLFERKSFKYVLISGGYWVVTCTLMGAIICAMAK